MNQTMTLNAKSVRSVFCFGHPIYLTLFTTGMIFLLSTSLLILMTYQISAPYKLVTRG